jgi:hypothetical protein
VILRAIDSRVVMKDRHGSKDVLYRCDGQTDVSYWTDLVDIIFEYSLKIHEFS